MMKLEEAIEDLWAVEYSVDQDAFHVDTAETLVQINRIMISGGMQPQYSIVAMFGTREECIAFAERGRPAITAAEGGLWTYNEQ